jgi:hypothetical protein
MANQDATASTRRQFLSTAALATAAGVGAAGATEEMTTMGESVLFSVGRASHIPAEDDVYGWLVGGWHLDVIDTDRTATRHTSTGEVHFAWALEGRAIQDVWIIPARAQRSASAPVLGNRYGTTLRVYDPARKHWRITWINPVNGAHNELIGVRRGDEIVQEGDGPEGARIRWRFIDIRPDAFRWLGEFSTDEGKTWHVQTEFQARRTSQQPLR